MPIVLVSLLDEDRQWFKSKQGLDQCETSRNVAFCHYTIQQNRPLIVPDALNDPRFASNPLVTGDPGIRFYAGVPLAVSGGFNIGTLCVIDTRPRRLSEKMLRKLEDLAGIVRDVLELRRIATQDHLTGALSRRQFMNQLEKEIARARRHKRSLSLIALDIDHFKSVNDVFGHAGGDAVLVKFVQCCRSALRAADFIGRLGGEEFGVVLPETSADAAMLVAEKLRKAVEGTPVEYSLQLIEVTTSLGVAEYVAGLDDSKLLLEVADAALYEAKRTGRNKAVLGTSERDEFAELTAEAVSAATGKRKTSSRLAVRE